MLFTSQSTPLPLLCRKLLPLSQQLRQESGKFLGIRLKNLVSLHQLFEYCFCSFLHKSIFGYWYFGLETKKARSGEPLFMLFPPLFIIVFHITTHAVIIHIILRGRIKAAHIIRLMGRSTLLMRRWRWRSIKAFAIWWWRWSTQVFAIRWRSIEVLAIRRWRWWSMTIHHFFSHRNRIFHHIYLMDRCRVEQQMQKNI